MIALLFYLLSILGITREVKQDGGKQLTLISFFSFSKEIFWNYPILAIPTLLTNIPIFNDSI